MILCDKLKCKNNYDGECNKIDIVLSNKNNGMECKSFIDINYYENENKQSRDKNIYELILN